MPTLPLNQAAALYDVAPTALRLMRGGHHTHVYRFSKDGADFVLRLIPRGEDQELIYLQATVHWLQYLVEGGALVPEPIPTRNGSRVESILHEDQEWLVVAVTLPPGLLAETLGLDRWDPALFQELGRSVGAVHALSRKYIPPAGLRRPDWDAAVNLFNHPPPEHEWLARKQAAVLERIRKLPRGGDDYGMIHAGLHFGNFVIDFSSRSISLIDFDDCAYGWFVMDLAVLLFDILVLYEGPERLAFAREFMIHLLNGYCSQTSISRFWVEQIPLFLKLLEINLYADLLYLEKTDHLDPWVRKFLPGRREKIENDVPYIDIDFETLLSARRQFSLASSARPRKPVSVKRVEPSTSRRSGRTQSRQRSALPLWREMRRLIAVKLYLADRVSRDRAARIAGQSSLEFLLDLSFYNIFPLEAELIELEKQHAEGDL